MGNGYAFPAEVPTIAGQLSAKSKTWRGYMEDMSSPCQHPELGAVDGHVAASPHDQYGTRHNPFVYFRSLTSSPDCAKNVVNYSNLGKDLQSVTTTANLSYIIPNLCHDGHDSPCVDGTAGGLGTADEWLKSQVPAILTSPAYQQDGMLVITVKRPTAVPSASRRASPEERPAPWRSPRSPPRVAARTAPTTTTACWRAWKISSRCPASRAPANPGSTPSGRTSTGPAPRKSGPRGQNGPAVGPRGRLHLRRLCSEAAGRQGL